jgi:hypothetical protein
MFDAITLAAVAALTFTIGFAIAWLSSARTREQLAAVTARAEELKAAAADKHELVDDAKRTLSDAFKALSADALDRSSRSFLDLATTVLDKHHHQAQGDLEKRRQAVDQLVQPIKASSSSSASSSLRGCSSTAISSSNRRPTARTGD